MIDHEGDQRQIIPDGNVEETPVPPGGERVIEDDQPWDVPAFEPERVQAIGRLIGQQTDDPTFIERLEAEIRAETLSSSDT